jgi:hypothetical protein
MDIERVNGMDGKQGAAEKGLPLIVCDDGY